MRQTHPALISGVGLFFLVSGACALTYQVAWQRLLFTAFGADLESITIIVSSFMLGLGVGAIAGGLLADRYPKLALTLFALLEGGVGAFGWISPYLLRSAGDLFLHASTPATALVNFLLVLAPTFMMGATLPILITDLSRRWENIGRSTGVLYSVNTLGAAIGAFAAGHLLFDHLALDDALRLAALGNFLVAGGVLLLPLLLERELP